MKYTVQKLEVKTTSTGKTKMDAELRSEDGVTVPSVTLWGDFPQFDTITFGSEVEGDLVAAKDPKYGPTLYPAKKAGAAKGGFSGIKAAQDRKAESIANAQENKEWGIMTSATLRDAVLLAIEENRREAIDLAERVLYWRAWLIENWDIDPKDRKPF